MKYMHLEFKKKSYSFFILVANIKKEKEGTYLKDATLIDKCYIC